MNPPEGYRELEQKEEILPDDIAYENAKFQYQSFFLPTIRKIEQNMIKNNQYRFFIDNLKSVIFACSEMGGYGINIKSDIRKSKFDRMVTINCLLGLSSYYSEIPLNDLKYFFNDSEQRTLLNLLKINLEKIKITEEQKNEIIQILKVSRAFNGDSAMEMTDKEDFCYQLAEEGVLKAEGNKFYVEKQM